MSFRQGAERSMAAGWFWFEGWTKLVETFAASQSVIKARQPVIDAAWRTPLMADYSELWRMGAEKVEAFGEVGRLWWTDMAAVQRDMILQGQDLAAVTGKIPSFADAERIGARATRIMTRSAEAGGRALAPVHKTATANARRLKRKP